MGEEDLPLTRSEACQWAVSCYTIQDDLTNELIGIQQADYVERLRAWGRGLVKTIENLTEKPPK